MKEYLVGPTVGALDRNQGTAVMASTPDEAVRKAWILGADVNARTDCYTVRTAGEPDLEVEFHSQSKDSDLYDDDDT